MAENSLDIFTCVGDFCIADRGSGADSHDINVNPWLNLQNSKSGCARVIANLECSFTNADQGLPFKWANLRMPPSLHSLLDGLSMAVIGNNHIGDYGFQAIKETQALLRDKGILTVGEGSTLTDAIRPAFLDLKGKKLGVVSLCCPTTNSENIATHTTPGVAPLGMKTLKQAVEGAYPNCDALIVYLHWGCEWVHDPVPDQLRLARHAIDCGADAVIGCHSHTIQSYEKYRGRWIFYGLGNFLFDAGRAQSIGENGEIKHIPLRLNPPNRESLAVSFHITPDNDYGRLMLDSIQPMYFGADLIPRPIEISDLTFDIESANIRLRTYVDQNDRAMSDRSEPVFRARLRNGVLAYWYCNDTIHSSPKHTFKKLMRKILRNLKRVSVVHLLYLSRRVKTILRRLRLAARVEIKWRKDKRHLPLTKDHRGMYDIIHHHYFRKLGAFPDLINCRDFNDKIQWLKLFDQDEQIIRCSDKILVRDYARERIGNQYLVKLYQTHDHFSQIDFDALPNSFVIKTNHDSGSVILVRDKSKFNHYAAKEKICAAMKQSYGWKKGEWAYAFIQPQIFVEEFIDPQRITPPPDYKFYCINGVVRFVHYIYDRGFVTKEQTIDPKGNDLGTELYPSFKLGKDFKKPAVWDQMISVAERLSEGFKCVRVDLFCSGDRIYAGEMTFWPMAGCYKGNGQKIMGKYLDFDRTTFKVFLLSELKKNISHKTLSMLQL